MELKDTVEMMLSEDYKERFKAEYYQLKIRCDKLNDMLSKYKNGTLDFNPTCSYEDLYEQFIYMEHYIVSLEMRALSEGIRL